MREKCCCCKEVISYVRYNIIIKIKFKFNKAKKKIK